MEWTEEQVALLKVLWPKSLSATEIGKQLGVTKNAIISKGGRLGLPPRPSPKRRRSHTTYRAPTLTRLSNKAVTFSAMGPGAVHELAVGRPSVRKPELCCWPIGDPGTKSFHSCKATAEPRKPYCTEHQAEAHLQKPKG